MARPVLGVPTRRIISGTQNVDAKPRKPQTAIILEAYCRVFDRNPFWPQHTRPVLALRESGKGSGFGFNPVGFRVVRLKFV